MGNQRREYPGRTIEFVRTCKQLRSYSHGTLYSPMNHSFIIHCVMCKVIFIRLFPMLPTHEVALAIKNNPFLKRAEVTETQFEFTVEFPCV